MQGSSLRYISYLWPLPILFGLGRGVMWLNGNSGQLGMPVWWVGVDVMLFLLFFGAAAFWSYRPIRHLLGRLQAGGVPDASPDANIAQRMETVMIHFPLRALKGYLLAGWGLALYLIVSSSLFALLSAHHFSWPVFAALTLDGCFVGGVLLVALALAGSMAFTIRMRRKLFENGLFAGHLDDSSVEHYTISIARRPWVIFLVSGFLPLLILVGYIALSFMASESEAAFIVAQAVSFLCESVLGSVVLIWHISHVLSKVTREISDGLQHLAAGDFSRPVPVLMDGDLGELARGLNTAMSGLQERDSLKHSLAIAAEIQTGLLPERAPEVHGYELFGFQQTCYAVGGDYYDYITLEDGRVWLVVADVSGKGYAAALTMANLQAMIKGLAKVNWPIEQAVQYLNEALCDSLTAGRFVTLFMAKLQPESHQLIWISAGHVPQLLRSGETIRSLAASGPPLGLVRDAVYQCESVTLQPDDLLFAFTDGVTESSSHAGVERFGEARLRTWLAAHGDMPLQQLPHALIEALNDFGRDTHDDDLTLLCVRRQCVESQGGDDEI